MAETQVRKHAPSKQVQRIYTKCQNYYGICSYQALEELQSIYQEELKKTEDKLSKIDLDYLKDRIKEMRNFLSS